MKVRYFNRQDKSDLMNGVEISESSKLAELLDDRRKNLPFIADLSADNGYELMLGIGADIGCVQYSRTDGEPPYLVALPAQQHVKSRYFEFLMNDSPIAISGRHILSFDETKQIALYFLETGERSDAFSWEEI